MSKENIIIRPAEVTDFDNFHKMEIEAWKNTPVKPLSREMFETWISVHQKGFPLAFVNGQCCAHIYAQICDYNPRDRNDLRNLYEMTDNMWTVKTHDPKGDCIYSFSICSIHVGAARKINDYFINMTLESGKKYYGGAVRMSGLESYKKAQGRKRLTLKFVREYAQAAHDTIKGLRGDLPPVYDDVITPLFKIPVAELGNVIPNFFPYGKGSEKWGCVVFCENPYYNK